MAIHLALVETVEIAGFTYPYSLTLSPDGHFVYVTDLEQSFLGVLSRDLDTGKWALVQVLCDGEEGVEGIGEPRALAVSPDSRFVYAGGV